MSKKVYIEMPNEQYHSMFLDRGWSIVRSPKEADLIQFTGGSDVSPGYYREKTHPTTNNNRARDKREVLLFGIAKANKTPMAGICRGGQFLNVMCGGRLWQNVDRHAIGGTHEAIDLLSGETFQVTSTHHQMMKPGLGARVVITAHLTTKRESMIGDCIFEGKGATNGGLEPDVEAVFYKDERVFCFQPHPEFSHQHSLAVRYLSYIENLLLKG